MKSLRSGGAITLAVALVFLASSCSSAKQSQTTTTTTSSTTSTTLNPVGPPPALKLTQLATVNQPTAMAQRDGDPTLYIAEKAGVVQAIRSGSLDPNPVLDIHTEVGSSQTEQGLLGIAFAPDSAKFYVDYTDLNGDTHVTEFTLGSAGTADLHSRREILSVKQPYPNHNGGQLAFGPDGMLYIGLGDGGSEGDPQQNGQNLSVLLGKILRINPAAPTSTSPYAIPYNNPFVSQQGARGEIWAYGLRNPWRFSFDTQTKNLWIGDVGQDKWEEVNMLSPSDKNRNFGWSLREGLDSFSGNKPADAIDPIYQYAHTGGACSIIGGYVYHGAAMQALSSRYLFGDYCTGQISTLTQKGSVWQADATNITLAGLVSFGQDHDGELYALSLSGSVDRIDPA